MNPRSSKSITAFIQFRYSTVSDSSKAIGEFEKLLVFIESYFASLLHFSYLPIHFL
jgi:hypothetical protein